MNDERDRQSREERLRVATAVLAGLLGSRPTLEAIAKKSLEDGECGFCNAATLSLGHADALIASVRDEVSN